MTFFTQYTNLALIAILLVSGGLLAWPVLRRGRGGLSAAEATQLINRRNAVVIDLRAVPEFADGHLPSARQIAAGELGAKIAQIAKNKSTPVLLVCQKRPAVAEGGARGRGGRLCRGARARRRRRRVAAGRDAGRQTRSGEVSKVLMYSTQVCPYCMQAERLLKLRGVEQIEKVLIDRDPARREEMMTRTGRRTVPQIYIGDTHVGGYDDLSKLDREGGLLPLLQAA